MNNEFLQSELVTYSDSNSSSVVSGPEFNEEEFDATEEFPEYTDLSPRPLDFFNLQGCSDNSSFWTTTGHDATLLPTREDALKIVTNLPDSSDDYRTDVGSLPPTYNPGTPYALRRSKGFNLLYTLEPETQDIVCPALGGPLIYPRLALVWPFLSVCGPFKHHPNGSSSTTSCVALWQWPPPGTLDRRTPKSISPCVTMSPVAGGHCVWSAFRGGPATTDSTVSGQLHLLTADSTGSLEVWDLVKGSKILHFNAVRHCGGVLRCCAVPTSSTSASTDNQQSVVLTGGSSGVIGCWDCRAGTDPTRPQNTFTTSRSLLLPTSDLLWLTDSHFASCSDAVDRDISDASVAVWDIRFTTKPISHQIYQERWGCARMALRPFPSPRCSLEAGVRFAVQTHGNAIVEVCSSHKRSSSSSISTRYRMEDRWRYEGHDCQAHPLGLAYSSDGRYLASGSFSPTGPCIWSVGRRGDEHPGLPFALLDVPGTNMVTDVVWIPAFVMKPGQLGLISIRQTGEINIYSHEQR